jgi:hypothetical protein
MALFSLLGKLSLDSTGFNSGLKTAETKATSFASQIGPKLAAAFSAAAVVSFAKATYSAVDNIRNLADAYDVTTEKIQLMQEAAARNGVQAEQMLETTVRIGEARKRALDGDMKAIQAFSRMGISLDDLNDKNKDNADLISQVAKTSSETNRNFQHQADLVTLIGGGSVKLIGALRELETLDINIIKDKDLEAIDQLGDKAEEAIRAAERGAKTVVGTVFRSGQMYFEAIAQFQTQFWTEIGKGGTQAGLRAFRAGIEGIKSVFQETQVDVPAKRDYPTQDTAANAMPAGYTREGRATGEPFDVPVAVRKRERMQLPSTGDLARIGGLSFGADYNLRLLRSIDSQVSYLSKIADATKTTADVISQ